MDLSEHTFFFRVRTVATAYYSDSVKNVYSAWSDICAIGKNADNFSFETTADLKDTEIGEPAVAGPAVFELIAIIGTAIVVVVSITVVLIHIFRKNKKLRYKT